MTLATQNPPTISPTLTGPSDLQISATNSSRAKSVFASKTVWGIIFTAVAAIAPTVGERIDAHSFRAADAAQIVVILCGAASAIIGRIDAGMIYTPDGLPGPNRSDFDQTKP
ncbi:MAG: hypothetical protein WCD18_27825 [Thermosynechococcaceae cyanobacterium]